MISSSVYEIWSNASTLELIIASAFLVFVIVLILLFVNTKWFSTNVYYRYGEPVILPQNDKSVKKFNFASDVKNSKQCTQLLPAANCQDSQHVNINFHTIINNEGEVTHCNTQNKALLRNRGSCTSSSDSTTSGSFEEEATSLRHREVIRCPRPFSFQDQILQEQIQPLNSSPATNDCVVVLQQDQVCDIQTRFDTDSIDGIIGRCGVLEVAFAYDAPVRKMTVHILQARDIPIKDHGHPSYTQIRAVLLPGKKQKQKTKLRSGDNPQYIETFLFSRIAPEEVNNMSIRFRLYCCEKLRRHRLIGECIICFSNINLQLHTNIWIPLEPRANSVINAQACEVLSLSLSDSTGSMQSMQHGGVPELLLGLSYNGTTGRLSVEIIKGSYFRHVSATRAPDTCVKLLLINSTGQEIARSKTSVRRSQTNPLFKEIFVYQVALFELCDITLMIIVYHKKTIKKKERIGWFTIGKENSSDEEFAHWNDMKQCKGEQLSRWHMLLET